MTNRIIMLAYSAQDEYQVWGHWSVPENITDKNIEAAIKQVNGAYNRAQKQYEKDKNKWHQSGFGIQDDEQREAWVAARPQVPNYAEYLDTTFEQLGCTKVEVDEFLVYEN